MIMMKFDLLFVFIHHPFIIILSSSSVNTSSMIIIYAVLASAPSMKSGLA
jgi:hypothetical protein